MPRNYVKKGYTECQKTIAKVWMNNGGSGNPYNATHEQLRTDPAWRCYVCTGQSSSHYDSIVNKGDIGEGIKAVAKDYTDAKGRVYKARIVEVKAFYAQSSQCGVRIYVAAHKQTLQGRSLAYLKAKR